MNHTTAKDVPVEEGTSDEISSHETKVGHEIKNRHCLMCGRTFESQWVGERVCGHCKHTDAWRNRIE